MANKQGVAQGDTTHVDSAMLYLTGTFKKYNPQKAYQLFLQRADTGEAKAMNAVGLLYTKGLGVDTSRAMAAYWLLQAANHDYTKAWVNLGMLHKHHSTDSAGYAVACGYFANGIAANEPSAFFAQGYMLYKGLGCLQSYTNALAMFRQGIDYNRPDCMYFTGLCFKYGYGVAANADSATYYIDRAAQLGYHQANAELAANADSSSYAARGTGRQRGKYTIPATALKKATTAYTKTKETKKFVNIAGMYTGTLTQYDYSGKLLIANTPLILNIAATGNKIIGQWQMGNANPISIQAAQQGNQLVFAQTNYTVHNSRTHKKEKLQFTTALFTAVHKGDSLYLKGTLQMYNTYTHETEKPINIQLTQNTKQQTTNPQQQTQNTLSIFPNPVTNHFTIAFVLAHASPVKLQVYNPQGQPVYTTILETLQAGKQTITIDKDFVTPGIYVVKLSASDKKETIAFVKE